MPSGGGGGDQTTTQTSEPWAGIKPYLRGNKASNAGYWRNMGIAPPKQGLYPAVASEIVDRPTSYFGGQTYADFAPQTQQALSLMENRALEGSPGVQAAQDNVAATARGDYLEQGNPYTAGVVESALQPLRREFTDVINPSIDSAFSAAGRGGSNIASANARDMAAENYARRAAGVASNIGLQTYENERGRQMQAGAMAPGLANYDYQDIGQLANVGQAFQGQEQLGINEAMARHQYEQEEPWNRLGKAASIYIPGAGIGGSSEVNVSGGGQSPLPQTIMGGLGGAGTGYMIGGPYGAAAGGLLGAASTIPYYF